MQQKNYLRTRKKNNNKTDSDSKKQSANYKRLLNIGRYKNDLKLSVDYQKLKAENANPKVMWTVKSRFNA